MENAKIQIFKCDILGDFQTLCILGFEPTTVFHKMLTLGFEPTTLLHKMLTMGFDPTFFFTLLWFAIFIFLLM